MRVALDGATPRAARSADARRRRRSRGTCPTPPTRIGWSVGHDVAQQLHRRRVRPVQIVEHHQHRLPRRRRVRADRSHSRTARTVPRPRRPPPVPPPPVRRASSGTSRARCAPRSATCAANTGSGSGGDELGERLDPRLIRHAEVLVAAAVDDQTRPASYTSAANRAASVVLPIPGSPANNITADPTSHDRLPRRPRSCSCSASRPTNVADTRRRQPGRQRRTHATSAPIGGSHRTRNVSTGSSRPFSSNAPTGSNTDLAARPGQHPHQLGRQDLAAVGLRAQPGRLHHRQPEVVAVLQLGLARPRPRPGSPTARHPAAGP